MANTDQCPPTANSLLLEEAAIWQFMHHLFRLPDPSQWEWLGDPLTQRAWGLLASATEGVAAKLPVPDDYAAHEVEYIAAFEVGAPSPPCPLIESHWNKDEPAPRILHENVLYYQGFGLELRSAQGETADHLRYQLEFLRHLCISEAEATDASVAEQFALGRRDFTARRLRTWVPLAASHIREIAPDAWYTHWVLLLESLIVTGDAGSQPS